MSGRASVLLLALAVAGCGYALTGRGDSLPAHIRRIGVPMFQNHSDTPNLERILTEAVRQELQGKGRYAIVQESTGVDAVLTGTVRPISLNVAAVTPGRQAQQYVVTVSASVEFKDVKDSKVIWANPNMRASDEYDVTSTTTVADPAAVFSQDQNALTRLAKRFARELVQQILENF